MSDNYHSLKCLFIFRYLNMKLYQQYYCGLNYTILIVIEYLEHLSGWTPKTDNSWIDHKIQERPLQIKTNSRLRSGHLINVTLKDEEGATSYLNIEFNDPPTYAIGHCTPSSKVNFTMPKGEVQVWTITKYPKTLRLRCNGVQIVSFKFSDSDRSECVSAWGSEKVAFQFDVTDTASDFYRAVPNYGN